MVSLDAATAGAPTRVRWIMLKHHRCPQCGYDIRLLPADAADGATVCPECGCAWRLEESGVVDGNGSVATGVECTTRLRNVEKDRNG